jgi:hypothetical protein
LRKPKKNPPPSTFSFLKRREKSTAVFVPFVYLHAHRICGRGCANPDVWTKTSQFSVQYSKQNGTMEEAETEIETGMTLDQLQVAATPHTPGALFVVIAPAGCGKSTVANKVAMARIDKGLTGHVVYSYNATGKAMLTPFAESLASGRLTHGTFHQFARMINVHSHNAGTEAPAEGMSFLCEHMEGVRVDALVPQLLGVFKKSSMFSMPQVKLSSVVNHLGDLANGVQPPEYVTWQGLATRWASACPARRPCAWKQYADLVLEPLQPWGCRTQADKLFDAPSLKSSSKPPSPVPPYEFVRGWMALAMVRLRLYDPFLNAYRLELAWFPERFDLAKAPAFDFLIVDEAQDVPGAESLYLPRVIKAWACEAWFAGDPHQELYTFMGTVNMLRTVGAHATRRFVLSENFRVPTRVWEAAEALVNDLPDATLVRHGGSVTYLRCPPKATLLDGCVLLFRGNHALVTFAAQYKVDTGRAARVSRHCFCRVQGAWSTWRAMVDKGKPVRLVLPTTVDEDTDDFSAMQTAFQSATGKVLQVLSQSPVSWMQADDDGLDARDAPEDWPPLLSTVHGFKGQGHDRVVLMPGIVPGTGKVSVDTAHGRLVYTAITRCSSELRVVTGKRSGTVLKIKE